jgi:type VI secretion system secreted protein Hcp
MASDTFAKIGDIKGESLDAKHKDEVEMLSWSWGLSNETSGPGLGSGGSAEPTFKDLQFTHVIDKASPKFMTACATGQHIKDATITARKAGRAQQEYLLIKMNDVVITSVALASTGEPPIESVTLQFAKIDLEYRPQKADGSLDAGVHFKFDLKTNKA